MSQGTFTACHLSGPVVGGMFAAMNWWRGSFWVMVPFMLAFAGIAYARIPEGIGDEARAATAATAAALATGEPCGRGMLRRRRRAGRRPAVAPVTDGRWDRSDRHHLPARQERRQQPVPDAGPILERADRARPVDPGIPRHDPDIGKPVPAAVAAGGARRVAGVREFPQHHHLVRLDHRHVHRFGLVGGARAGGADVGTGAGLYGSRLPDRGSFAAGPRLAGGEYAADGAWHRHLQRAPGRPHHGHRRFRRAAQHGVGADLGALAWHRVRRGDRRGGRQHRRARRRDRAASRRPRGDPVYTFCWIPFGLAAVFMFRFIRLTVPDPAPARSPAE